MFTILLDCLLVESIKLLGEVRASLESLHLLLRRNCKVMTLPPVIEVRVSLHGLVWLLIYLSASWYLHLVYIHRLLTGMRHFFSCIKFMQILLLLFFNFS